MKKNISLNELLDCERPYIQIEIYKTKQNKNEIVFAISFLALGTFSKRPF